MLDAVVANFIDSVGERDFYPPFMALLRTRRFYDIHLTHGNYEFGKDFVAKHREDGIEKQYVFQAKAGNLNLGEWSAGLPQIELLRHNELAHPNFSRTLPRRAVFVTTGRFAGGAALAAQDLCQQTEASDVPLTTWDRERLIEMMAAAVSTGLANRVEAPLLSTVAGATSNTLNDSDLESFSSRWCIDSQEAPPCVLECSIVATALAHAGRLDLAAYISLALVRAACWHTHGSVPIEEEWGTATELGRLMFATHAEMLFQRVGTDGGPSPTELLDAHREPGSLITHAVRCVRTVELLSLLGILRRTEGSEQSLTIATSVARFVRRQAPAAASLISDRWAVATIPVTFLLSAHDQHDEAADHLRNVFVWLTQRYGRGGSGLASATAPPAEEVRQVIGTTVSRRNIQRRDDSYLASVLLDLCAFCDLTRLYGFIRDDLRRLNIRPLVVVTEDSVGQYVLDGANVAYELNAHYSDAIGSSWTSVAPHLLNAALSRYLQSVNHSWDHLAVSAVLRDRHFVSAWSPLLT